MTKLRKYLDRQGEGALAALAKATGKAHSHISRIADGHKGPSLEFALELSQLTGIAPRDLIKPKTDTTPKRAKARLSTSRRSRA